MNMKNNKVTKVPEIIITKAKNPNYKAVAQALIKYASKK